MDNRTYLDQISAKTKVKTPSTPILTPFVTKIIAIGAILFILFLTLTQLVSANNKNIKLSHEYSYYYAKQLIDMEGPIDKYNDRLKSSTLRATNSTLKLTLNTFVTKYSTVLGSINISVEEIDNKIVSESATNMTIALATLEDGYYNGDLDLTFAATMYNQTSLLLSKLVEARNVTSNTEIAAVMDSCIQSLTEIQEDYRNFKLN